MFSNRLAILLSVLTVAQSSSMVRFKRQALCVDGTRAAAACYPGGTCRDGYTCDRTRNYCCLSTTSGTTGGSCSDGSASTGSCANNQACPSGSTCSGIICCRQCPTNVVPIGSCISGFCASGFTCNTRTSFCCSNSVCSSGNQPIGSCVNGACGNGYRCVNNNCCDST